MIKVQKEQKLGKKQGFRLTARGDVNGRANAVLVQTSGPDPLKKMLIIKFYFMNVSIFLL